ncbi:RluA family pseudouridine synthase [Natranaerobius trueperi]|uniref:Pseudouridine synthase n=1 Tax=Natranaerobius trueperi TaxID=759412 RepID=A0A226BYZ8_9FIRM|nr:RluA family pseudouridine synthase [Natranaerobius trueperi]OWZ84151.1 RNA pseudouridine synthase [Natranaerobius trueperi]
MEETKFQCQQEDSQKRLDLIISERVSQLSRSKAKELIIKELVQVNGHHKKPRYEVKTGDEIIVNFETCADDINVKPENIPIDIVYEDEDVLVVNKERGMVVHPGAGNHQGTLVNALLFHCENLSEGTSKERPGIVHRLDKDTSGLLVVAKNDYVHQILSRDLQNRDIKRTYLALVSGNFPNDKATIDLPIARDSRNRKKMSVQPSGKRAVTRVRVLNSFSNMTLLKIQLETGRTHQIRVHMSHLGYPLVGDPVYGTSKSLTQQIEGQALHSFSLSFNHPKYEREMFFRAPLPNDMKDILKEAKKAT